ncbi:hypothetical protein [Streptomyces shenzhenensis]|uniref:hypothetical protein n=1 Tax=Streptomyces shenzhenensis TaxID=943815 RepID=UPI003406D77F
MGTVMVTLALAPLSALGAIRATRTTAPSMPAPTAVFTATGQADTAREAEAPHSAL